MRSFPSSAEVAREAELEKQELAMKRKRSAHEVRITIKIALPLYASGHGFVFSCPEQLNRLIVPLTPLTIRVFTTLQSDPRDL